MGTKGPTKRRRRSSVLYVKQDFLNELQHDNYSNQYNDYDYAPVGWRRSNDGNYQRRKQRTFEQQKYKKSQRNNRNRNRNRNKRRRNRNFNPQKNQKNNQNNRKKRVWKKKQLEQQSFDEPPKQQYKNKNTQYQIKSKPKTVPKQ